MQNLVHTIAALAGLRGSLCGSRISNSESYCYSKSSSELTLTLQQNPSRFSVVLKASRSKTKVQ